MGFQSGGSNFYSYVGNDPIDWDDPWGLRKCIGQARVMQGNRRLIGKGGAFNGWPSNLGEYGVTADSAAVVPSQFGQNVSSMRSYLEEVDGTVSGSYTDQESRKEAGLRTGPVSVRFQ